MTNKEKLTDIVTRGNTPEIANYLCKLNDACDGCAAYAQCQCGEYNGFLEWLDKEVE